MKPRRRTPTDEAIASFTSIIDNSPIQPDALLKFVRTPSARSSTCPPCAPDPRICRRPPGRRIRAYPLRWYSGDADTIAADGAELYDMVRDNNPLNRFISCPAATT